MKPMRMLPVGLLAVAVVGCGNSKYVPVSGVVTLNGQPYKNAVVSFQPVGSAGNEAPGRGSSAVTDEKGRFTLMTDTGQKGAVAGKHRVRIQTSRQILATKIDPTVGSSDKAQVAQGTADPIPQEWYSDKGGKDFEVPAGGTDKANFDIVTRK